MRKLVLTLLFFTVIFPLESCRRKEFIDIIQINPRIVYAQGVQYIQAKKLAQAYKKFQEVIQASPLSELGRKARFMSAFVKYRLQEYSEAADIGRAYILQYSEDRDSDYMHYLVGMCYMNKIRDVPYDQKPAELLIYYMDQLIRKYPDSQYVDRAKSYVLLARNQLAAKEMQIGRYYLEDKECFAAIQRFRVVVESYSDTEQVEEALSRLVEAYLMLGLVNEATDISVVLKKNYPQGFWRKSTERLLKSYGQ
ncbi:outer membrane protein assembly factor BamD [Candidatus Liberibacter sp.]|uniref:outer membrane protein assembly factor BamD n=1 Tax=Candidatus Liberibacter sp. TaxID=34022 RepID=UPI0015F5F6EB|nr:outer membrane protein assembly factor BamD [Candidatus Liberibacter sp.]MBA5724292.1 outer membrane protein assembly factor BamD [Candidatus Liberibacter sp.]